MKHLTAEELIDLAEGTGSRSWAPHLDSCEPCRRQLAELTTVMARAAEVEVPEPSPLFWEHFSTRVREAVAATRRPTRPAWFGSWSWPRIVIPLAGGAIAAVVIAVMVTTRGSVVPPAERGVAALVLPAISEPLAFLTREVSVEASLGFVVNLTEDLDFDTARDAGLTADGSAEHAVTHLSDGELAELQRLLQVELARPGA